MSEVNKNVVFTVCLVPKENGHALYLRSSSCLSIWLPYPFVLAAVSPRSDASLSQSMSAQPHGNLSPDTHFGEENCTNTPVFKFIHHLQSLNQNFYCSYHRFPKFYGSINYISSP